MSQTITKGIWATGREYGLTEGKAEDVLRILARQQGIVSESLEKRVRVITDVEKLNQLFDLAFDCQSLDEFAQHLS